MTKCNQCGIMNVAGIINCQSCGALLSGAVDGGVFPRATSQEQPELPAWLESLRAGERSIAPTHTGKNFSASDFIEEDSSVPSWMRAERNEARNNTGAHVTISSRQSSASQFRSEDSNPPPSGIPVRSLLDEQSLPSWVRDGDKSGSSNALSGGGTGQDKISFSGLGPSDDVPSWMKSLQQNQPSFSSGIREPEKPVASPYSMNPSSSDIAHSTSTKGFSARDLIDPASPPSWMTQLGEENAHLSSDRNQYLSVKETSSPSAAPSPQVSSPSISASVPAGSFSGQTSFSVRDLIDPQSLPSWMVQQQEQAASPARQQPQFPGNESVQLAGSPSQHVQPTAGEPLRSPGQLQPGQTFSASSLLDMDSLPSWLRESGQAEQAPGRLPIGQPSSQPLQNPLSVSHGNGISVSSLIDMDSVPGWLHQMDQSQNNNLSASYDQAFPTKSGSTQPNIVAGSPRGESMRVPNRPRAEINPNECESAASTLASMLGVASSVPNFSVSVPPSYPMPSGTAGGNSVMSPSLHPTGYPPSGPSSYSGLGVGAQGGGYPPAIGYDNSYQEGMNNASIGNVAPAPSPYVANSSHKATESAKTQKQTKKRGLFGAIYEWLTR